MRNTTTRTQDVTDIFFGKKRFFGCMLAPSHLWTAIAYVELNPVRAKMARRAEDYMWSSAIAHVTGGDGPGLLDMDWWRGCGKTGWCDILQRKAAMESRASEQKIPAETE